MDLENPLYLEDIPVAQLICIEVMGQPDEEVEIDRPVKSYCKKVCEYFTNLLFYLFGLSCFFGFFFYILVFPL
jgi:hypothetical protein